jgi:hypothetical protein
MRTFQGEQGLINLFGFLQRCLAGDVQVVGFRDFGFKLKDHNDPKVVLEVQLEREFWVFDQNATVTDNNDPNRSLFVVVHVHFPYRWDEEEKKGADKRRWDEITQLNVRHSSSTVPFLAQNTDIGWAKGISGRSQIFASGRWTEQSSLAVPLLRTLGKGGWKWRSNSGMDELFRRAEYRSHEEWQRFNARMVEVDPKGQMSSTFNPRLQGDWKVFTQNALRALLHRADEMVVKKRCAFRCLSNDLTTPPIEAAAAVANASANIGVGGAVDSGGGGGGKTKRTSSDEPLHAPSKKARLGSGAGAGAGGSVDSSSRSSRSSSRDQIKRCVVQLGVFKRDAGSNTGQLLNIGSGTIISCRGHILTAAHNILNGATGFSTVLGGSWNTCEVLVAVFAGDTNPARWAFTAKVVSTLDALTKKLLPSDYPELSSPSLLDVAVLQITAAVETKPPCYSGIQQVQIIKQESNFDDVFYLRTNAAPDAVEVGSNIVLYGYPLGDESRNLRIAAEQATVSQLVAGFALANATAVAGSGFSGGPMINRNNEVVDVMSKDKNNSYMKGQHLYGKTNLSWFRRVEILDGHGMPTEEHLLQEYAVQSPSSSLVEKEELALHGEQVEALATASTNADGVTHTKLDAVLTAQQQQQAEERAKELRTKKSELQTAEHSYRTQATALGSSCEEIARKLASASCETVGPLGIVAGLRVELEGLQADALNVVARQRSEAGGAKQGLACKGSESGAGSGGGSSIIDEYGAGAKIRRIDKQTDVGSISGSKSSSGGSSSGWSAGSSSEGGSLERQAHHFGEWGRFNC